jgi:T1SS-143 domain-containing protein
MATEVGVVKALMGEVTATAADGSERILRVGDIVYANELISTGPGGAVELEFADGSVMDLGRSSQAMLDSDVIDPSTATNAIAQGDDVPEDVAALQQAILEGEDPTEGGEATAAGAGVQNGNEGHEAVFVNYLNPEITPEAGFDTIGVNSEVDDYEDEQLLDGQPTAGLFSVLLDEDDLNFSESIDFVQNLLDPVRSEFQADTNLNIDNQPDAGSRNTTSPGDDVAPPATFFSGTLNASFGSDGPGSITFNAAGTQPSGLTSGGEPVQIWVSADGLTIIGYVVSDDGTFSAQRASTDESQFDGADLIFSAQITDLETYAFKAGLFGPIDHPDSVEEGAFEENLLINIAFTITDADGDAAQGIVRLNVDDDSPVIGEQSEQPFPGEGFQLGDYPYGSESALVDEDDTENGVGNTDSLDDNNGPNTIALPINFGADGPAEVSDVSTPVLITGISGDTLTSNGQPVVFQWNNATSTFEGTVDGEPVINIHVDVSVPSYAPGSINGVLTEVSVELIGNLDHPQGADGEVLGIEDNLNINVEYTASDADGDQVDGNFDLSIDDDMPVIGTPEAVSVDEEGINGNAGDSYDADATVNGVLFMPELENGDLNSALDTDAKQAIKSFVEAGGQLVINGSYGSEDESLLNDIFGFSITNGSNTSSNVPTFSQTGAVTGTDFESGPAQLNNPNGTYTWDISSLPAEATVMYSDGDDAAVVTIPVGDGQITFLAYDWYNAAPTGSQDGGWTDILDIAVSANGSPAEISVFDNGSYVDTSGGTSAESDNVQDTLQSQGHNVSTFTGITLADILAALPEFSTGDLTGEETVASGSLAINWGADNNNDAESDYDRSVVFSEQSAPEGLTADGQPVTYTISEDGTMLTAFTGEQDADNYSEVFTISLSDSDSGSYTFTLLGNLDHPEANTEDDINLNFSFIATDSDGDKATSSFAVTVDDDAPIISAEQPEITFELNVTNNNEVSSAGYNSSYGYYIKSETGEPTDGMIIWNNVQDPANESATVTIEGFSPDQIGFFIIPNGFNNNPDLENETKVTFEQDGDDNWQAVVVDGEPLAGSGSNVLFDVAALNNDGQDHVQDNALAGNQNWEDLQIPTGDGDYNDVNVNVEFNRVGGITVDETDIGNGGSTNATAAMNLSASFISSFGADGAGDIEYSLSADTDVETGLVDTLTGKAVELRVNAEGEVEGYITTDDNLELVVFTASVDEDGEVTLTQSRAVEHDDVTNPDEALSPATVNAGAIALTATITDGDGDSADASLDLGVLLAFEDDGPSVDRNPVARVDDDVFDGNEGGIGDGPDANFVTGTLGHDFGQDGAGSIAWSTDVSLAPNLDDFTFENGPNEGELLIKQDGQTVLTLTLNSETGEYTVTQNAVIEHKDGRNENNQNFEVTYIVTDGDGDTTEGLLKISVDDDTPTIDKASHLSVQETDTDNDGFDVIEASGQLSHINEGADGASITSMSLQASADFNTLRVGGEEVVASQTGNVITVNTVGGEPVFELTYNSDGEYTYKQFQAFDHQNDNPSRDNSEIIKLGFNFTVTDGDGDTAEGSLIVTVNDDEPVARYSSINVAELDADNDGELDVIQQVQQAFNFDQGADGAQVTAIEMHNVKADGTVNIWNGGGADVFTLSSGGENIIVTEDGTTITGTVGENGPTAFTIELNNDGTYTYTQYLPLDHAQTPNGQADNLFTLSFKYTVTDADGDTDQAYVGINIEDDVPSVGSASHLSVQETDTDNDGFDVIEANGQLSNITEGADGATVTSMSLQASADFNTLRVGGEEVVASQTGNVITVDTVGGEPVFELTYNSDGEYTYKQFQAFDHQNDNPNRDNSEVIKLGFSFTVTDADGDTDDGLLVVQVNDDEPTVAEYNVNSMRIISDDDTANPYGNPGEGSNTNDGAGTDSIEYNQVKTLQFSAGADGGTVAWNVDNSSVDDATAGISFSVNADGSLIITQMQNGVPVEVAEITLDANTGDYNYTQTSNLLHTPGDNENEAAFTLGFTVTDGDGDTADGHLTLLIDDDSPVVTSQQINLLTESFENFAPDLSGNNWTVVGEGGGTIIGNNGIEWTVNGAGIEIQSGNVGGARASDGDVHAELDAHDSNGDDGSTLTQLSTEVNLPTSEATLSFDFQPRPSDVNGSDMVVSLGGQIVSINVDGAGVIDFDSLPAGVSATQTSSAGGWTTITLTFTGLDTDSAQTLTFEGVGSADALGAYLDNISLNAVASLTVDESVLADGNGEAGASDSASYDFSTFFSGEFGADGAGDESFSLNLNGSDVASGLYAVDNADTSMVDGDGFGQGNEIVLNQSGNVITGSAGGVDYFTISVNPDTGEVTLTQLENIWHADTTNPDDAQGMMLDAETLSLIKTLTDADGDSAEASLDLSGVNFNFEDDAPVITAEQPTQPFLITVTNEGGDAGYNNTYGFYIKGDDGQPESGQIIWSNVKEHVSDDISVDATDPSDIGFFIIPDGADLNALTDGAEVTFQQDGDGNWQVVLDGTPLSGQGTNVLFDNADLNPGNADAMQDNAAAGNQNWEDIIGGDNDFNDVNINVSITRTGTLTLDETVGERDSDPNAADEQGTQASGAIGYASVTADQLFNFDTDGGADGEDESLREYSLALNFENEGDTEVSSGLNSHDGEILLSYDNGDVIGHDGEDEVFRISMNADGDVTVTQFKAIDHGELGTDGDAAVFIDSGVLAGELTIFDNDGDSTSARSELGQQIAFEDDAPSAIDDTASVVAGQSVEGNVFDNDDASQDAPLTLTSIQYGDETYTFEGADSDSGGLYITVDADNGTLKIYDNGEYIYTADQAAQGTINVPDNSLNDWQGAVGIFAFDGGLPMSGATLNTGNLTSNADVEFKSGEKGGLGVKSDQQSSSIDAGESLLISLNAETTSATVGINDMNVGQSDQGKWTAYNSDGEEVGSGTFNGEDNNGKEFTIDINTNEAFSYISFGDNPDNNNSQGYFVSSLSYQGTEGNVDGEEFIYNAVDADGTPTEALVSIDVNNPPEVSNTSGEGVGNEDGAIEVSLLATDDHSVESFVIKSLPDNGTLFLGSTEVSSGMSVPASGGEATMTFVPNQDWSDNNGDDPVTFEYVAVDNDGVESNPATATVSVTSVTDTPDVSITLTPDQVTELFATDLSNVLNNSEDLVGYPDGFSVTAMKQDGDDWVETDISVKDTGSPTGFGVAGNGGSNGADSEIESGEKLFIQLDTPASSITFQLAWLNGYNETAEYTLTYDDGTTETFSISGGSDQVDPPVTKEAPYGKTITAIEFATPTSGDRVTTSDYLVHSVTYAAALMTYSVDIAAEPTDMDGSESITHLTVTTPEGVTLSDSQFIETVDGHSTWSLYVDELSSDSNDYSGPTVNVSADGEVTVSGLTMTVPSDFDGDLVVSAEATANEPGAATPESATAITGDAGDNDLMGTDGVDILFGGEGNDILIGGADNDILTGGAGADIFQWNEGDEGSAASPAVDFITDFSATEGDSLNLSDLLQGEESGDITDYISVAQNGDDVVINVTPDGDGGDMNQVITLQNTTVDQLAGGVDTSGMSQADIINTLINNGQLNVDQS